jgi:hypothetical protein
VHRLSPLASPPAPAQLTATEALGFPAVQLFVAATLDEFELTDTDAPIVAWGAARVFGQRDCRATLRCRPRNGAASRTLE